MCPLCVDHAAAPQNAVCRDEGWRAIRIAGELDFSLVGILADIARILAECRISIFAVSTYNTDYVMTKEVDFDRALAALVRSGYRIDDLT